jgi:hypothetical protein
LFKSVRGHGTKFGRKEEAANAALLTHHNIDEAAKAGWDQRADPDRLHEGPGIRS